MIMFLILVTKRRRRGEVQKSRYEMSLGLKYYAVSARVESK